jgi:phage major head subunit gpT-like protein
MDTLQNAEVAWSAMLQDEFEKFGDYSTFYPELCETYESRELTTNLALVLGEAIVREWKDREDRIVDHFSATSYEVGVRDWALTFGIPKRYVDYDRLGVVASKITRIPRMIPRHYQKLVSDALIAGFTTACWDGQSFFDTAHPYFTDENNAATYGNTATQALSKSSFEDAVIRLRSIRSSDDDDPLNPCSELELWCAPQNEAVAEEIVAPSIGSFNRNAGKAKVMPYIPSAYGSYWFLWDKSLGLKPIFLKVNKRMDELVIFNKSTDANVFYRKEIVGGVDGEHEVAYLHPMCIFGSYVP